MGVRIDGGPVAAIDETSWCILLQRSSHRFIVWMQHRKKIEQSRHEGDVSGPYAWSGAALILQGL